MSKITIEYDLPINDEEKCKEINNQYRSILGDSFTPFLSTEEHMDILIDKLVEGIQKVGDEGGWYLGDGIKVKIELEYDPENK